MSDERTRRTRRLRPRQERRRRRSATATANPASRIPRRPTDRRQATAPARLSPSTIASRYPRGRDNLPRRGRLGIELPHLCYSPEPGYRPDGNCRVCMVEIEGERVLAASCIRTPSPGMKVKTQTDRAKTARKMVAELLLTDQPARASPTIRTSQLLADRRPACTSSRAVFRAAHAPAPDRSHPAMAVNLDACIQCNLCVRACREVQVNDVIGMAGRGHGEKIVFDFDDPMGASTCVACGECVQACPTGALMPATLVDDNNVFKGKPDRTVDSVCPYCGVGCQLTYHIKDDKLRLRHRQERPGQREPAVRQGPLRLRLRAQSAAAAKADDPQGRRAESPARSYRPVKSVDAFPRSDLGRGARPRRRGLEENPRPRRAAGRWPVSAPPKDRTKRPICSRSWFAPASAPTMSITARGCAMPPRLPR